MPLSETTLQPQRKFVFLSVPQVEAGTILESHTATHNGMHCPFRVVE